MVMSGCASNNSQVGGLEPGADLEPNIIQFLPPQLEGYQYEKYKNYGGKLGYSLRYRKDLERHHFADFFIWPVSKETMKYAHKEIVFSVAEGNLNDIYTAQEVGMYSNIEVLTNKAYDTDGQILVITKLSMLRGNLSSLSYLVVTEYRGNYIKARVSFPDNEANRKRDDIEPFVVEFINEIIGSIEHA